jgi:regulator of protease activity HflC (stomatin/prohibitin superfamily)
MVVFLRVMDPANAVLKVRDYRYAAQSISITTLRSVIGDISLDSVLSERERINDIMQAKLDEVTERWGVKVNAVEIREIEPPRDIQDAMSRVMSAERHRRAVVTESEGTREAAITIATGDRDSAILNAEGLKQAAILNAEGEREAAILNAEGYSIALQRIFETASRVDQTTMRLQYLEMLRSLASGGSTTWVLPMELTSFVESFAGNLAAARGENGAAGQRPSGA